MPIVCVGNIHNSSYRNQNRIIIDKSSNEKKPWIPADKISFDRKWLIHIFASQAFKVVVETQNWNTRPPPINERLHTNYCAPQSHRHTRSLRVHLQWRRHILPSCVLIVTHKCCTVLKTCTCTHSVRSFFPVSVVSCLRLARARDFHAQRSVSLYLAALHCTSVAFFPCFVWNRLDILER